MSDLSDAILALLTDEWQSTADISGQIDMDCDPKIKGNRVRHHLVSFWKFRMAERQVIEVGSTRRFRWRRIQ